MKVLEIQRAEKVIMDKLPPLARVFVANSRKINVEIEKFEQIIMSVMNENGAVNGKMLNEILNIKFPKITEWINIPCNDFYLKDEIEELFNSFMKERFM